MLQGYNLQILDTLGQAVSSFVERLSSSQRCKLSFMVIHYDVRTFKVM